MARRRAPRIVPALVMSAGFASVVPTCALVTTQGCGSDTTSVADIAFGDRFSPGTDVASDAFSFHYDVVDVVDATLDDSSTDATDAQE